MSLTIGDLQHNNIRLDSSPPSNLKLPRHVKLLTEQFLDFKGTFQDLFDLQDKDDPWEVHARSRWAKLQSDERDSINNIISGAEQVQESARKRFQDNVNENSWNDFYRDQFLRPLQLRFERNEKDTRIISKEKFFYDSFELHGEKDWLLFDQKRGFRKDDRENLTQPRPDRACYFTIHNTKSNDAVNTTRNFRWKNIAPSKLAENFSLEILDRLVEFGLQACPLNRYLGDSYKPRDLQCFPWLIIEHKRDDPKKEQACYCQAANDSVAALMLLQTAAMLAEIKEKGCHVPPVVSVTTMGHIVRVWVAYYSCVDGKDRYHVKTIWSGDMTRVLDILKFEAILENVHSWATRTLKPLLSMYIDQWRNRFLNKDPKYGSSMLELHSKLQELNNSKLPRALNLAKALDDVMTVGFDRGRQTALVLDHRHLSHSTDSFRKSENEELLVQLERIIETKMKGLQVSLANIGVPGTKEGLPSSLMFNEQGKSSGSFKQNQSQGTSKVQQPSLESESDEVSLTKVSMTSNAAPGKNLSKIPSFKSTETLSPSMTRHARGSRDADAEKNLATPSTEEQSQRAAMDIGESPVRSETSVNTEAVDPDLPQPQNLQKSFNGKTFNFHYQTPSVPRQPRGTRKHAAQRSRRSASPSLQSSAQSRTDTRAPFESQSEGHLPLPLPQQPGNRSSLSSSIFGRTNPGNLSVPTLANRQRSSSAGPTVSTDPQQSTIHATAADSEDSSREKTKTHDKGDKA